MKPVIFDTGPLVAWFCPRDEHHAWARKTFTQIPAAGFICEASWLKSVNEGDCAMKTKPRLLWNFTNVLGLIAVTDVHQAHRVWSNLCQESFSLGINRRTTLQKLGAILTNTSPGQAVTFLLEN